MQPSAPTSTLISPSPMYSSSPITNMLVLSPAAAWQSCSCRQVEMFWRDSGVSPKLLEPSATYPETCFFNTGSRDSFKVRPNHFEMWGHCFATRSLRSAPPFLSARWTSAEGTSVKTAPGDSCCVWPFESGEHGEHCEHGNLVVQGAQGAQRRATRPPRLRRQSCFCGLAFFRALCRRVGRVGMDRVWRLVRLGCLS